MHHPAQSNPKPALSALADWWHELRERRARIAEIESLDPSDLARMAEDVGLSAAELKRLAAEPCYAAELLDRRLDALGLSKDEIRSISPLLLTDLQRSCSHCTDKRRCADDLAEDPQAPGWESYCPNSGTLRSLT
jgi:uncharacterized protein YjiS (DUF1127 family)